MVKFVILLDSETDLYGHLNLMAYYDLPLHLPTCIPQTSNKLFLPLS